MLVNLTLTQVETPIGTVVISGSERGIRSIQFTESEAAQEDAQSDLADLQMATGQLEQYFSGDRTVFDSLRLAIAGTDFQQRVWDAAMGIPFGQTITYGELAKEIGDPKAARAVGGALNANPLLLVIPCHRIVSSNSSCGGFAAGVSRKEWLIDFESTQKQQLT